MVQIGQIWALMSHLGLQMEIQIGSNGPQFVSFELQVGPFELQFGSFELKVGPLELNFDTLYTK